jgi:hypothetical protein
MYKGVIAFILLQLVALGIVAANPSLVNYLPNRVSMTAPTAPPPRNPKLQYCIEELVNEEFSRNGAKIRQAIDTARGLDISYLPKKLAGDIADSFDEANKSMLLLTEARRAEVRINEAAVPYRPVHRKVRLIEYQVRQIDDEIQELGMAVQGLSENETIARKGQISALENEKAQLTANIPDGWDRIHQEFSEFTKAETNARRKYRRTVDSAYSPIFDLIVLMEANDSFTALEDDLVALRNKLANGSASDEMVDPLKALAKQFGAIKGANDIKSQITKSRRILGKKSPKIEEAISHLEKAIEIFNAQHLWREQASTQLLPHIRNYEQAIRGTIGLRQQKRLAKTEALYVAACTSGHRDISLHF